MLGNLLAEEMLVLFAILALGGWLGTLTFRRITLGSVGVLFVALAFGHFGLSVPKPITDLGLLLFVYAVGLQAGPSFFRMLKRQGLRNLWMAVTVAVTGALATVGAGLWMRLPFEVAAGMYTGALTCTPALASAIDAVGRLEPGRRALTSLGYGVAYPFSMIGVVLLVQFLPRLLKRDLKAEEAAFEAEAAKDAPALRVKQFRITNPNIAGKRLADVNPQRLSLANITRVRRGDTISMVSAEFVFRLGDVVMAVGRAEELDKLALLLGEETQVRMDLNTGIRTADVDVTEGAVIGKKLADLQLFERYDAVVTRLRRQGAELTPTGSVVLEMGDSLHVVGEGGAVDEVVRLVGAMPQRAEQTSMVSFLLGLMLGVALGSLPIPLAQGIRVKLGPAGGAFLVSLVAGHFGRIGRFRLYVPQAAKNLSRELGLMLFLAGVGTSAGAQLMHILENQGWRLVVSGMAITTLSVGAGLAVMLWVFRLPLLAALGALCATMTNPPGLAAAAGHTRTNLPTLSYASVYPAALILKILIAQLLVEVLWPMA